MKVLQAGALYFVLVFSAGFLLGPLRILWLVPAVGTRLAELLETPVMLIVIFYAARWVIRRLALPPGAGSRLGMGVIALTLMLAAELSLVLRLRGMTLADFFATRDPVSGLAYYLSLAVFALMPLYLRPRRSASGAQPPLPHCD